MSPPDTLIRLLPPCLHWHPDGEIRVVGHRIGLYHFVYNYNRGFTAEMILCQFPTLELATIHKVSAFYLDHHDEVDRGVVHPLPEGFTGTMEEMCAHVARYPDWVLAVVVLFWSATAFVSTWVAARIGNRLAGISVAYMLTVAIVFNVSKLRYAMWFKVVMLSCCFPVACYVGGVLGVRMASRAADSNTEMKADLGETA